MNAVLADLSGACANDSARERPGLHYAQVDLSALTGLRAAINSQDRNLILFELNELKVARSKADILPYVQSLWREQVAVDPELNWDTVRLPLVKVEVANILLQATRNGFILSDVQEYREYVRKYVLDSDATLARNSILTLSIANDGRDVPLLLEAARRQHPSTFGAAVLSLSYMCHESASDSLDGLEKDVADEGPKDYLSGATPRQFIQETRVSAAPVREFYSRDCE